MAKYKVLWIEDETDVVAPSRRYAEKKYDINFCHCTNWVEGKMKLEQEFDSFSAIILDLHCRVGANDAADDRFFSDVIREMNNIFDNHNYIIPWFIYTAGAIDEREKKQIYDRVGRYFDKEWGKDTYYKDRHEFDNLLIRIQKLAKDQINNIIRSRFENLFKYLDNSQLFAREVSVIMLKGLKTIFDSSSKETVNLNDLRSKVLEKAIIETANKYGLLPQEFYSPDEGSKLANCLNFLTKKNLHHNIFSDTVGSSLDSCRILANSGSHNNSSQYTTNGVVFLLCDVLVEFGKYCLDNPNVEKNRENTAERKAQFDKLNKKQNK